MKPLAFGKVYLLLIFLLVQFVSFGQRGKIIKNGDGVLDPNHDGYVSKTIAGFSSRFNSVQEFEIKMFGLPKVLGKEANAGSAKDLIPDSDGHAVYAGQDAANNLIFRFRVGKSHSSIESWSILIDTDDRFGDKDPNATPNNPGFELDITLVKTGNKGIFVHKIDGIDKCTTPTLSYSYDSHCQVSIADDATSGSPDYFYDYYVPFADLSKAIGITANSGLKYAAVSNSSGTCGIGGKISDVSEVDDDKYGDCHSCMFKDIMDSQCPTHLVRICQTGEGFSGTRVHAPAIVQPLLTGARSVLGTTVESNIFVIIQVYTNTATAGSSPAWGSTPRERHGIYAVGTKWSAALTSPLRPYDKVVVSAQFAEHSVPCDDDDDENGNATSFAIVQPNHPPVANNQTVTLDENKVTPITLSGSDTEGSALTYTVVSTTAHGTLSGTAPNLTFTPALYYFGTDSFTFKVNDGSVDSNVATVSIVVKFVNHPPVANLVNVSYNTNTPVTFLLSGTDVDGNTLSYVIVSQPAHGAISGVAPNLTYTPVQNYIGSDSFTFKVNDGTFDSNTSTVSINHNSGTNHAPVANGQSVILAENAVTPIALTAVDIDGNSLSYTIVGSPAHGTLTGTAPNLTYVPSLYYYGPDNFTFKVSDGTLSSNTATVSITVTYVNHPPVAINQSITTNEDASITITLTGSDVDGNSLTFKVANAPTHGTLSGSLPAITYTPTLYYAGNDSFTFLVNDGTEDSSPGTVFLSLTQVNHAPVANNQDINVTKNVSKAINLTGTDVDGNSLTYTVIAAPTHGTLSGAAPDLVYMPAQGYIGNDGLTFKANDGSLDSSPATISLSVTYSNLAPTVTALQVLYTREDSTRLVCPDVVDIDQDILFLQSATNTLGGGQMIQASAPYDFCYSFTPPPYLNGRSNWELKICDEGGLCATAAVQIIILPKNDPPFAINDEIEAPPRETSTINVLDNDRIIKPPYEEFYDIFSSDPNYKDFLTLSTTPVKGPFHGTVKMDPNGVVQYTPRIDFSGPDSVRYTVCDNGKLCSSATLFIKVAYPTLKVYDGLSPNGDGKNDYWRIDAIEQYPNNTLRIFDRYNNLVYETTGYSNEGNNWQGQSNRGTSSSSLVDGTYYYSLNLGNGEQPLSGYVILKRQ